MPTRTTQVTGKYRLFERSQGAGSQALLLRRAGFSEIRTLLKMMASARQALALLSALFSNLGIGCRVVASVFAVLPHKKRLFRRFQHRYMYLQSTSRRPPPDRTTYTPSQNVVGERVCESIRDPGEVLFLNPVTLVYSQNPDMVERTLQMGDNVEGVHQQDPKCRTEGVACTYQPYTGHAQTTQ